MDVLTPIDEDEEGDDDQPITMLPKIIQTAPSPSTEYPPSYNSTTTATITNNAKDKEINQMESVL